MNVYLIILCLLFFGCSSKNEVVIKPDYLDGNTETESKNIPKDVCDLLAKDLILRYFDVHGSQLELEEKYAGTNYHQCGFKWEKPNFEELKDRQREALDILMHDVAAYDDKDYTWELSISDVLMMESPYAFVQVGQFTKFKNVKEAESVFSILYDKPDGDEILRLNNAIFTKEFGLENLDIDQSNFKSLIEEFKFKKIKGIGDQAYYDMINKSINVRFGTLAFRVYIDSEFDISTNIEIGKSIALHVWEKL